MVKQEQSDDRRNRISAARAELSRRYAENPEAVQRFEARKAHIEAARKRERQRVECLGEEARPADPDLTRPGGMSRQDWKIERNRRLRSHRKAMVDWNRKCRTSKLNGPTPEQSAKALYVETSIHDHIAGRRIKIPASRSSLADLVDRKPSAWSRLKFQAQRAIAAVEPWYEWGPAGIFSVRDETGGDGWYFNIDWLGLHLGIMFGRTPKAVRS